MRNLLSFAALVALLAVVRPVGAASAPPAALALMPKGAISLQTKNFATPGGETLVHLYTVPTGHSKEREAMGNEKRTGPVKREHIETGPSIDPSPFYLDVLSRKDQKLQRLNSVPFIETKDAQSIELRWLWPAKKQGPVVVMKYGFMHWYEWILVAFPKGFSGPYTVQRFDFGGEGEIGVSQNLSRVDKSGTLMIEEKATDEKGSTTSYYKWDGVEFFNAKTPYFVIGASVKTRAAAEAFVARTKLGEVRPSSNYKKLAPGLWIVVMGRFSSAKEAEEMVKALRTDSKISAYVKRAC